MTKNSSDNSAETEPEPSSQLGSPGPNHKLDNRYCGMVVITRDQKEELETIRAGCVAYLRLHNIDPAAAHYKAAGIARIDPATVLGLNAITDLEEPVMCAIVVRGYEVCWVEAENDVYG